MSSSTIILLASARKESDTFKIVEKFFPAKNILCIDLLDERIAPYNYTHEYPGNDSFYTLIEKCIEFEKIIFATPVYWYSMSGVLKNFFDRLTDIVTVKKEMGRKLAGKSIAFIAVGTDAEIPPGFETPFKSTAEYFDMRFLGFTYCCTNNDSRMELSPEKINAFLKAVEID